MKRGQWSWQDDPEFVPDLTPNFPGDWGRDYCPSESEGGVCTRLEGHTGRHAAGNGDRIIAVWE